MQLFIFKNYIQRPGSANFFKSKNGKILKINFKKYNKENQKEFAYLKEKGILSWNGNEENDNDKIKNNLKKIREEFLENLTKFDKKNDENYSQIKELKKMEEEEKLILTKIKQKEEELNSKLKQLQNSRLKSNQNLVSSASKINKYHYDKKLRSDKKTRDFMVQFFKKISIIYLI